MKKTCLTLVALCAATLAVQAQQQIETYSVYDVNHDGVTKADDAALVANSALGKEAPDQEMVEAATITSLLQSIDNRLEGLQEHVTDFKDKFRMNVPDENGVCAAGHDYVDLGLKDAQGHTIYWATCNIGADKPEDPGLYFAWAEVVGYGQDVSDGRKFDWESYRYCHDEKDHITKYFFGGIEGLSDHKTVLLREDDAASRHWGGSWRMPTEAELDLLRENCNWVWDPKKVGMTVTGPTGKSIFLPAAGYRNESDLVLFKKNGYYWSSSLGETISASVGILNFTQYDAYWGALDRCCGLSVRAICVAGE